MLEQTLAGKVAIVSGSSSGIGAAIVRELSARGALTVVNFPFSHLEAEARTLVLSLPSPAIVVEADMSTVSAPSKLVDAAVSQWGKIDIIVNCAGLAVNKPFEEQTLADWDLLVNVNGRGTFLLTQASLPHLTRGSGRIVNIVSISARGPPPNQTIYAGTKGMCDSFTKCWSVLILYKKFIAILRSS
jgi:NAD(P)-dependent dehydrogenase (short-subunit alcohol dehydrogenase family)